MGDKHRNLAGRCKSRVMLTLKTTLQATVSLMRLFYRLLNGARLVVLAALTCSLPSIVRAQSEPMIASVVPGNLAMGVSPSAPVVFTFSEAMDPAATEAMFLNPLNPFTPLPVTPAW